VPVAAKPWVVPDELWERIEPLLPKVERRFRYPGRKRLPDRQALQGILFVLQTGIAWRPGAAVTVIAAPVRRAAHSTQIIGCHWR
jgi:transposase